MKFKDFKSILNKSDPFGIIVIEEKNRYNYLNLLDSIDAEEAIQLEYDKKHGAYVVDEDKMWAYDKIGIDYEDREIYHVVDIDEFEIHSLVEDPGMPVVVVLGDPKPFIDLYNKINSK